MQSTQVKCLINAALTGKVKSRQNRLHGYATTRPGLLVAAKNLWNHWASGLVSNYEAGLEATVPLAGASDYVAEVGWERRPKQAIRPSQGS